MVNNAIWKIPLSAAIFGSLAIYLIRTPSDSAESTFQMPLGVVPLKDGVPFQPSLRNGYLKFQTEIAPSQTCYRVSLSADRIDVLVERLANEMLPDRIYAILVASSFDPDHMDSGELTYLSDFRDKAELMKVLAPYRFRLIHDGFVGFGFAWYDRKAPNKIEEIFVTTKKIIVIKTSNESLVDRLLRDEQIPLFDDPCFITDYETAVTDLRGCAEVFGDRYEQYRIDKYLTSVYVPRLIDSAGFQQN